MFDYVLALLRNKIHKHPPDYQDQVDLVERILTEGQGYLTKKETGFVRVIFFNEQKNSKS